MVVGSLLCGSALSGAMGVKALMMVMVVVVVVGKQKDDDERWITKMSPVLILLLVVVLPPPPPLLHTCPYSRSSLASKPCSSPEGKGMVVMVSSSSTSCVS